MADIVQPRNPVVPPPDPSIDTQYAPTNTVEQPRSLIQWMPWFIGGALSILTFCAIILFGVVLISGSLNAYLAWQLNPIEIVVTRPDPSSISANTASPRLLSAVLESSTTEVAESFAETDAAGTSPAEVISEPQTLAQVNPEASASNDNSNSPQSTTSVQSSDTTNSDSPGDTNNAADSASNTALDPNQAVSNDETTPIDPTPTEDPGRKAPLPSNNQYDLIPIPGGQDDRPANEHGDHNLKLRGWIERDDEPKLRDVTGARAGDPPRLDKIFQSNFARTYRVHKWDWGCNCKMDETETIPNNGDPSVLAAISTTPGQAIKIPPRNADIYNVNKKYYAVVLYASEDSLTFVYDRKGNVVGAYAVHYEGLNVDPNLLEAFRNSPKDQLPGLTLDTPVGTANGELIVAIRDKGAFMDIRTRKDWWR